MFQFKADLEDMFRAARDPSVARRLNPELQTFSNWLAANIGRIHIE